MTSFHASRPIKHKLLQELNTKQNLLNLSKNNPPSTTSKTSQSFITDFTRASRHHPSSSMPYTCLYKNHQPLNSSTSETSTYATSLQIYKHKIPQSVKTSFANNSSLINSKIKENSIANKEKKDYLQKVTALKRRILALQNQQEYIDKKQKFLEKKQKESEKIKNDKKKLQTQIDKVIKDKEKEKNAKKIKAQQNKQNILQHTYQNAKDKEKIKKENYIKAITERKIADQEIMNYHSLVEENNKKNYTKAKELQKKAQKEEQQMFINKEEELKKFYTIQAEMTSKETDALKKEYEYLAKIEQEAYQKLKDSQNKTDEMNRISVNKVIHHPFKKSKHRHTSSEKTNRSFCSINSSRLATCATPKPFYVNKTGNRDSFCYTHQTKKIVNK